MQCVVVKLPCHRHILHGLRPKILAHNNDKRCRRKDSNPTTLESQQDDEIVQKPTAVQQSAHGTQHVVCSIQTSPLLTRGFDVR
jgi:hypothetical protein